MKFLPIAMTLTSTLMAQTNSAAQPQANLILTNGKIWTGSSAQPQAEAVACAGNRIVAVGSAAEIESGVFRVMPASFSAMVLASDMCPSGSDWFVAPMEPILGIYGAATRRTLDGKHPNGWIPEQKITVAEALRAYTWGSAYASFEEGLKGTIEPGKLADLAVLSEDILTIAPADLASVKVAMTVFDGKIVYRRP